MKKFIVTVIIWLAKNYKKISVIATEAILLSSLNFVWKSYKIT